MKLNLKKSLVIITILMSLVLLLLLFGSILNAAPNLNPTWYVDARVINHRQCSPYDYYGAKDPCIVYSGGKYHVFYTGANQSGGWQMCYTSASTIDGLRNASRSYMSKIGEGYFCAPEVFYFEPKSLWYLIYQDGTYGVAYATTTNIADPNSWSGPKSFGVSDSGALDFFIICDDSYAYMYYSKDDGNIYLRRTTLANFPSGWGSSSVALTDTFEADEFYKCLSDGKYYALVEDLKDGRYYELWQSSSAGGPWTKLAEKWAWRGNLSFRSDQWTTNVSHGNLIRKGKNQKYEIDDINKVDFLIQGTTNTSGAYQQIPWDLGVIHNYNGPTPTPGEGGGPTPTPTRAATVTPTPTQRGSVTATPTPTGANTPTPTRGGTPGNYAVAYTIQSDWGNGATVSIVITNNTTTAVNGWTLAWTFPGSQTITNLWNGTYTQSGAAVSVKDAGFNANIPANGGSTNFGFNINYSGTNGKPTSFTLNGTACQVQ